MADTLNIDGHKLIYHPREVSRWLTGEEIFPLYAEISPTGACNHRCMFCALDYLDYAPRFLDTSLLKERIAELGRLGLKSIMFGGEGEPLLHRDLAEIIHHTKEQGIDVALTTNGVLLSPGFFEQVAASTSWIKISLNAGTAATYAGLHRTGERDFEQVLDNIGSAAQIRSRLNANCTIGVQAILLSENGNEMELLAGRAKQAGADYLVVKSYSQHQFSLNQRNAGKESAAGRECARRLQRFSDDRFRVIVRLHSMAKLRRTDRGYGHCLALPFWTYIDAGGTVWGCSAFLGDERFRYGSIREQRFEEIWRGEQRQRSLELLTTLDPGECRRNCRMDEINRYLWDLTHPGAHVNFI